MFRTALAGIGAYSGADLQGKVVISLTANRIQAPTATIRIQTVLDGYYLGELRWGK